MRVADLHSTGLVVTVRSTTVFNSKLLLYMFESKIKYIKMHMFFLKDIVVGLTSILDRGQFSGNCDVLKYMTD